jgi:protein required for attachment to host cells
LPGKRPILKQSAMMRRACPKRIASKLDAFSRHGALEHRVLVTDPQASGQVRPLLYQEVTGRMTLELARTLAISPVAAFERALWG